MKEIQLLATLQPPLSLFIFVLFLSESCNILINYLQKARQGYDRVEMG